MATQKQIAANRRNATQSTGPHSDEGKALDEITAEYHNRFKPVTPGQRALVDTLIDCEWLLRALERLQSTQDPAPPTATEALGTHSEQNPNPTNGFVPPIASPDSVQPSTHGPLTPAHHYWCFEVATFRPYRLRIAQTPG